MIHCFQTSLWTCVLTVAITTLAPRPGHAITAGQTDDFEDATTMNWIEPVGQVQGMPNPHPPVNVASGGPDGPDDRYLLNVSTGVTGLPGSAMMMFNRTQWTGDYVQAGVVAIRAKVANFGDTPLHLRVAFRGGGSIEFASTTAYTLPPDAVWRTVVFSLAADALTQLNAFGTLDQALGSVSTLRLFSNGAGPDWSAESVEGALGVDDIEAIDDPVAVSAASWATVKRLYQRPR